MTAVAEQVLRFACGGEALLGIVSGTASTAAAPATAVTAAAARTGVVIVVGGPQYRAGSHRQFVLLARALARAGFPVLRFDYRGMGDSGGALRSFEHCEDDIGAAIDAFIASQPGLQRVVLWGLCDGASAALLYLHGRRDARVAGLALLNPWVRSEASLAKAHVQHYYLQRLREPAFWRKLASGQVALGAITGLVGNVRKAFGGAAGGGASTGSTARDGTAPFQARMAAAWAAFRGPLLLMLGERDLTAQEFSAHTAAAADWQHAFKACPATVVTLAGADHTCSTPDAQQAMENATAEWLRRIAHSAA